MNLGRQRVVVLKRWNLHDTEISEEQESEYRRGHIPARLTKRAAVGAATDGGSPKLRPYRGGGALVSRHLECILKKKGFQLGLGKMAVWKDLSNNWVVYDVFEPFTDVVLYHFALLAELVAVNTNPYTRI